jgi:aldehyde dehydrogenase (NAD+)
VALTKPATRRDVLLRLGQLMKDHTDELIRLSVIDDGMTVNFARFLTASSIDWVDYYAGWADKLDGRAVSLPAQRARASQLHDASHRRPADRSAR